MSEAHATADDLTRLRAVAEAATPGPWEADGFYVRVGHEFAIALANSRPDTSPHDADFIATFDPPTVAALIDRVERAERERDRLDGELSLARGTFELMRDELAALRAAVEGLADTPNAVILPSELRALLTEGADDGQ